MVVGLALAAHVRGAVAMSEPNITNAPPADDPAAVSIAAVSSTAPGRHSASC